MEKGEKTKKTKKCKISACIFYFCDIISQSVFSFYIFSPWGPASFVVPFFLYFKDIAVFKCAWKNIFSRKCSESIDFLCRFVLKLSLPATKTGWLFDRKEKERKDEAAREKSRECRMPTQVIMNLKIQMRIKAGDQTKLDYSLGRKTF